MTMETICFLLNHMVTYCITVDLGKIVISVNIASVSSNYSIENPYYLHRSCMWKTSKKMLLMQQGKGWKTRF